MSAYPITKTYILIIRSYMQSGYISYPTARLRGYSSAIRPFQVVQLVATTYVNVLKLSQVALATIASSIGQSRASVLKKG